MFEKYKFGEISAHQATHIGIRMDVSNNLTAARGITYIWLTYQFKPGFEKNYIYDGRKSSANIFEGA